MTVEDLRHYLRRSRETLVRTLDGLGEYDVRRPLVPSGTNLLGLVKHLTDIEVGYLVECVGRPSPVPPLPDDGSSRGNADMWATAEESRDHLLSRYRAAWAAADASLAELPPDTPARVPWWPADRRDTTLGHLAVRVLVETAQHAGQAEILRETVDGRGGPDHADLGDDAWWRAYVAEVQAAADRFR